MKIESSGMMRHACCLVEHHLPPRPGPLLEDKECDPITIHEFRAAQKKDETCKKMSDARGRNITALEEGAGGILVRISNKDSSRQRIIPEKPQERILCLAQYMKVAGHLVRDRTFQSLSCAFFWSKMIQDGKVAV